MNENDEFSALYTHFYNRFKDDEEVVGFLEWVAKMLKSKNERISVLENQINFLAEEEDD